MCRNAIVQLRYPFGTYLVVRKKLKGVHILTLIIIEVCQQKIAVALVRILLCIKRLQIAVTRKFLKTKLVVKPVSFAITKINLAVCTFHHYFYRRYVAVFFGQRLALQRFKNTFVFYSMHKIWRNRFAFRLCSADFGRKNEEKRGEKEERFHRFSTG